MRLDPPMNSPFLALRRPVLDIVQGLDDAAMRLEGTDIVTAEALRGASSRIYTAIDKLSRQDLPGAVQVLNVAAARLASIAGKIDAPDTDDDQEIVA